RLQRFFTIRPNGYQISAAIRESIVFAPHNLIRDAPFTKMDLIACRNLLIYFQPHAQKTVLTLFHFALKPGGVLFLGSSESPGGLLDEFDTIDERAKLYRKRRDMRLPRSLVPRRSIPSCSPPTIACSIDSCRPVFWLTSRDSSPTPSAVLKASSRSSPDARHSNCSTCSARISGPWSLVLFIGYAAIRRAPATRESSSPEIRAGSRSLPVRSARHT